MSIQNKIHELQAELTPAGCTLVAVSKTHPPEAIAQAYAAGQRHFGENKVQELAEKAPVLPADIHWHLIGHLQRNKVKYIAPFVHLIHSVDSERLLEEINKQAQKNNRVIPCLLQVHIASEETKFGWDATELLAFVQSGILTNFTSVKIEGLMGMASLTENTDQVRQEFAQLKQLFAQLKTLALPPNVAMHTLSMGMSSDYKIAVTEGSTLVRIGSTIFGHRNYSV